MQKVQQIFDNVPEISPRETGDQKGDSSSSEDEHIKSLLSQKSWLLSKHSGENYQIRFDGKGILKRPETGNAGPVIRPQPCPPDYIDIENQQESNPSLRSKVRHMSKTSQSYFDKAKSQKKLSGRSPSEEPDQVLTISQKRFTKPIEEVGLGNQKEVPKLIRQQVNIESQRQKNQKDLKHQNDMIEKFMKDSIKRQQSSERYHSRHNSTNRSNARSSSAKQK